MCIHKPLLHIICPCGSFGRLINQKFILDIKGFITKVQWYDRPLIVYDNESGGPTLVMGASMVIEWIRAIDECLRCELPGRTEAAQRKNYLKFEQQQKCICSSNQCPINTKTRVEILYKPTEASSPSPSLPRDVDLTSREPFLRSLCLLDWMSGDQKAPSVR